MNQALAVAIDPMTILTSTRQMFYFLTATGVPRKGTMLFAPGPLDHSSTTIFCAYRFDFVLRVMSSPFEVADSLTFIEAENGNI